MAVINGEIRRGAYYDSVVLMQLQRSLLELPGIVDAGAVMGTAANKNLLAQSDLLIPDATAAAADDLVIVVKAADEQKARAALASVDDILGQRRSGSDQDYRPKSLEAAAKLLPEAQWVLVSVPGQYAAGVSREALRLGKNVFLYSDNVPLEEEVALKQAAAGQGLLVMGPDCGSAIVNGVGLGFANRVRRGNIGVVAAAGTGLQMVTARIHQLGGGVSHALGTGGRDLSQAVGAISARQALSLLGRDDETAVIVLISKPPAADVAQQLLRLAGDLGKPVVIDFIGYDPGAARRGDLHFARTLDQAAEMVVALAEGDHVGAKGDHEDAKGREDAKTRRREGAEGAAAGFAAGQRFVRGLFSGGTLAYEALLLLQEYVPGVYSNTPLDKRWRLANAWQSQEHTIVDLGEDEFTVGRPHPMIDNDLRMRRLRQEAADPEVAVITLDVVLGYGAHPDPAAELAPAIASAITLAEQEGRRLEVVAAVVGTDEDPQGMASQIERLQAAGAQVETSNEAAVRRVGRLLQALESSWEEGAEEVRLLTEVELLAITQPLAAINVGVESFAASLQQQQARVLHVDWRPPAAGNERLAGILARMREGK